MPKLVLGQHDFATVPWNKAIDWAYVWKQLKKKKLKRGGRAERRHIQELVTREIAGARIEKPTLNARSLNDSFESSEAWLKKK